MAPFCYEVDMNTVKMQHIDTGKTADVHPDEVTGMKAHGWKESEPVKAKPGPKPKADK